MLRLQCNKHIRITVLQSMFFVLVQYTRVSDEAATAAVGRDAWMWRPPRLMPVSHNLGQTRHLCVQKRVSLQNKNIVIPVLEVWEGSIMRFLS